jgi:hypothetical protein
VRPFRSRPKRRLPVAFSSYGSCPRWASPSKNSLVASVFGVLVAISAPPVLRNAEAFDEHAVPQAPVAHE